MTSQTRRTFDHELERRVRHFFKTQNPTALRGADIEVEQGVVTLRGTVRSFYARQVLVHGSRRVAGVQSVVDELRVEA